MFRRLLLAATAMSLLAAAPALAQDQTQAPASTMGAAAKPKKVLEYLTPADIDPVRLISPPPADGSPDALDDLAAVHRVIAESSPERLSQAKWDDDHEDPSAFYAVIGQGFDLKTLPATAEVLRIVKLDGDIAASAAKKMYPRSRPWAADKTITTCDPDDKPLTSYPSGHGTMGYSVAMAYAVLIPEKAQAFMARAADYAFSRQVCGSHYARDTQASEAIGAAVVTALLKNPQFLAKVDAARAELRAAKFTAQ
jgi:acid phosphatase (class A)